jgi:hypothetical protein
VRRDVPAADLTGAGVLAALSALTALTVLLGAALLGESRETAEQRRHREECEQFSHMDSDLLTCAAA